MGLIDFVKGAGAYLFGAKAGHAATPATTEPVTVAVLRQQIETLGITVDGLDVAFGGDVATVRGTVGSQSDREKVLLGLGNTPGVAQVDDQLALAAPEATRDAPPEAAAALYTVKKGDTLSAIAKTHYGNAGRYMIIFEANKPMLKNPDKIYPGQVLRIPPGS